MDRKQEEALIRRLCEEGRFPEAVERTLRLYGRELQRFTASLVHASDLAEDAFSTFREHLVKGLPSFHWRSSLRTWTHQVARNACYKVLLASASRREEPLDEEAAEAVQRERSRTKPWLRTDVKDRFRALRAKLDPVDQILLQLRVDQRRSWLEIARLMLEPDAEEVPSRKELERKSDALRQRFLRLKDQLRALAREEGLLSEEASSRGEGELQPPAGHH